MFDLGEYVFCPGHGVGQILAVENRNLADKSSCFFQIKIIQNGLKIMVPVDSKEGLRCLVGENEVRSVFQLLGDHSIKIDRSTWNRRYRDYMAKINTGSIIEIADVLRSLLLLKIAKKLSFGEKRMLELCRDLIVKEISLSTGNAEGDIGHQIDSLFN